MIKRFKHLTVVLLVGSIFWVTGCMSTGVSKAPVIVEPVPKTTVFFKANYMGKPLTGEPKTWKDCYDGGTWLYEHGDYDKAIEYFEMGANMSEGEAKRTCLMSLASSSLAAGNDMKFNTAVALLEGIKSENPFITPTIVDKGMNELKTVKR